MVSAMQRRRVVRAEAPDFQWSRLLRPTRDFWNRRGGWEVVRWSRHHWKCQSREETMNAEKTTGEYPARLQVDYPEKLGRLTTFFRLAMIIPIAAVLALI